MSSPANGRRSGAFMSEKQIARAVVKGQRLTFISAVGELSGYVIGMDDFHWLILCSSDTNPYLVHKSAAFVRFGPESLSTEKSWVKEAVEEMGESFRAYCARTYLGTNDKEPQQ